MTRKQLQESLDFYEAFALGPLADWPVIGLAKHHRGQ
jgi:hypothetical protein